MTTYPALSRVYFQKFNMTANELHEILNGIMQSYEHNYSALILEYQVLYLLASNIYITTYLRITSIHKQLAMFCLLKNYILY